MCSYIPIAESVKDFQDYFAVVDGRRQTEGQKGEGLALAPPPAANSPKKNFDDDKAKV